MAHRNVPEFPLVANFWHQPGANVLNPPDCACPAQLCVKTWTRQIQVAGAGQLQVLTRFIYLQKGWDIRPAWTQFGSDIIECPAGSQRYYSVMDVDDVAKGFDNEFRVGALAAIQHPAGGVLFWPVPIP